jgi:arginase
MTSRDQKTLRLLFPQWQGGDNPPYHFGAKLLAWLAPEPTGPVEEVPVAEPTGEPLRAEAGIVGRSALVLQQAEARRLIDRHQPDRIVILGGDCLVDLAPFAYLSQKYGDDLAVLWVDSHPDITTPEQYYNAHAMVLGNLLGQGDSEFLKFVGHPVAPERVMYVGLHDPSDWEAREIERLGLKNVGPDQLAREGTRPVLDWFKSTGAKYLAIHFDLDVLNPSLFHALLFAKPDLPPDAYAGVARGELTMAQAIELLNDVASVADVVGLGIAEHLPWDALALKHMLEKLPLIGTSSSALTQ